MSSRTAVNEAPKGSSRIEFLDVARGLALLAMAVYHFTWDLEFFGYLLQGTAGEGGWRIFARSIATSFLFLVGIGLVLAHARGIRWRPFLKRLAQVVAGALAITAATLVATPQSFVFFGILHQIALASVIGLAFLRLPAVATLLVGIAIIAIGNLVDTPLMDPRWLAWIGFSEVEPLSNDIVPLFPWTGVVILGIAAAQIGLRFGVFERLRRFNAPLSHLTPLTFIGRHSLAFYLIHQPVSLALIAGYAHLYPADRLASFPQECRRACIREGADPAVCNDYCGCAESELSNRGLLSDYVNGRLTPEREDEVREVALFCSYRQSE